MRLASAAAVAALLAACDTTTAQPAPGGAQPYPNVGTVPERPVATPTADRQALLGSLRSDRAQARYATGQNDVGPQDETRGATIGSVVSAGRGRGDPRSEISPAQPPLPAEPTAPDRRVEAAPIAPQPGQPQSPIPEQPTVR